MISSAPKLRSDLIIRRQETAGGTVFIIQDPAEEIALATKGVETGNSKLKQARDLYEQARRAREERLALTETSIKKAEERLQFGNVSNAD